MQPYLALAVLMLWTQDIRAAELCNPLKVEVRVGSCSGPQVASDNLLANCGRLSQQTLVKCRETCLDRKLGVCQKCGWKQVSGAACNEFGERIRTKKCGVKRTRILKVDMQVAQAMAASVLESMGSLGLVGMSPGDRLRFNRAEETMRGIVRWLEEDHLFVCREDSRDSCIRRETAGAVPLGGGPATALQSPVVVGAGTALQAPGAIAAVGLCRSFFAEESHAAAGMLIHEASHACCGTTDGAYYDDDRVPLRTDKWHITADTYAFWAKNGLCIPSEEDCEKI